MERDQRPSTSKEMKKDDVQKKEPDSPTKIFSQIAYLESERFFKTKEVKARLKFSKFLKTTREEIVRDHPSANMVHLRQLEGHQLSETLKRCKEVEALKREMREIDERAQNYWPQK